MTRLVQLRQGVARRVALVDEPWLRVVEGHETVHSLATAALESGKTLTSLLEAGVSKQRLEYDAIYGGKGDWKLLLPVDHPAESARCLVSGTGLTHLGSAKNRNDMHQAAAAAQATDSMRIFQWGVEQGKPGPGRVGIAPEWFYKGTGATLRAHGEPLMVPAYGEDGGEEAEVAGIYLIGPDGRPWRIGLAIGNEFSDHIFEKKNYLNLAGSKLRTCAIGPELVVGPEFQSIPGRVRIERGAAELWARDISTGEREMTHSLANLEHHHFKFEGHRRPGDVHVHFFGAHSLSFGDKVQLQDGDVMEVSFADFGRPLRNPLRVMARPEALIAVSPMA